MATAAQVARWASAAGWSGPDLVTAVAVGIASGGDEKAPGGVWGSGGGDGPAQAVSAFDQWKKSGWDSFPRHKDKRYLLFIPLAVATVTALAPVTAVTDTVDATQQAAQATADAAQSVSRAFQFAFSRQFWGNVLKVGIGSGLIMIGLSMIVNRNVIQPFRRGLTAVDEQAGEIASLRENVWKPIKRGGRPRDDGRDVA